MQLPDNAFYFVSMKDLCGRLITLLKICEDSSNGLIPF